MAAKTTTPHYLTFRDVEEIAGLIAQRIFVTPRGDVVEALLLNGERQRLGAWTPSLLAEHLKPLLRDLVVQIGASVSKGTSKKRSQPSRVVTIGD